MTNRWKEREQKQLDLSIKNSTLKIARARIYKQWRVVVRNKRTRWLFFTIDRSFKQRLVRSNRYREVFEIFADESKQREYLARPLSKWSMPLSRMNAIGTISLPVCVALHLIDSFSPVSMRNSVEDVTRFFRFSLFLFLTMAMDRHRPKRSTRSFLRDKYNKRKWKADEFIYMTLFFFMLTS